MQKLATFLLVLLLLSCNKGEKSTTPKKPTAKVPPEDVWASMRKLEKYRQSVDTALTDWNSEALSAGALGVSQEIVLFPELYEGLPPEFMQYANILKLKADATADAMKTQDFAQARSNWGEVLKACRGCHEVWSGPTRNYDLPPETPRPEPPPPPASEPTSTKTDPKKKPKKPKKDQGIQDPFKNQK